MRAISNNMRSNNLRKPPKNIMIIKKILLSITLTILIASLPFITTSSSGQGEHTLQIEGWTDISSGLPEEASFSAVDIYDADGDGLDEIYLGGAGRTFPKSAGIWAYEYDTSLKVWKKFGEGLPSENSGKYYGALAFGDVDKDGNIDLIAPLLTRWYDGDLNGIEIYSSDGDGGFSLSHTIDIGESANEAVVSDLDQDGDQDIIISTLSGIRVYFGTGSHDDWSEASPPAAGNEITGLDAGDLNNDGLMDIVGCPYSGSTTVRMYIQSPNRAWEEITFKEVRRQGFGTKIIDIDSDGNSDIIYGTRNEGIKAWLGNGGGSQGGVDFDWEDGSMGLHDSGGNWDQIEFQDITGDGNPELIAANNGGDEVYFYINDMPNGWTWIFRGESDSNDVLINEDPLRIGGDPYGANFGDWDGNNIIDCAACSWGSGAKAWLIEGNGTSGPISYPEGGEDPPTIWSDDDYFFIKILTMMGIITLMVIIPLIRGVSLSSKLISRKLKLKKKIKKEKNALWFFRVGNISTIIGIGLLFIFQIIAILYSRSYDPNVSRLPFWDPPEFVGTFLFSLCGLLAFLTLFEISRILTSKGISRLKKNAEDKEIIPSVKKSRIFNLISSFMVYLSIILIFITGYNFYKTEKVSIPFILFSIILILGSLLLFQLAQNVIPILSDNMKKIPFSNIIISSVMILVILIQLIFIPDSRPELKDLIIVYPIIFGCLIIITSILNMITLWISRKSFSEH
jgi:hypothetical protein